MTPWQVIEINGMSCWASRLCYVDKGAMLDDMRKRVGCGGLVRCVNGTADYVYRITADGCEQVTVCDVVKDWAEMLELEYKFEC